MLNNEEKSSHSNIIIDQGPITKYAVTGDHDLMGQIQKQFKEQDLIIESPFIILKSERNEETIENVKVRKNDDSPPPSYRSMIKDFLVDEPPDYGHVTGVIVNVNEVTDWLFSLFVVILITFCHSYY